MTHGTTGGRALPQCRISVQRIELSSGSSIRILICGDVDGNLQLLATNLAAANKRQGPFSFALCIGNFLGDDCDYEVPAAEGNNLTPARDVKVITKAEDPGDLESKSLLSIDKLGGDSNVIKTKSGCLRNSYLSGTLLFALPLFFIDTSCSITGRRLREKFSSGHQFSSTLEFLGSFGFRNVGGLTLGFLCGRYDQNVFFNESDDEESIDLISDDLLETGITDLMKGDSIIRTPSTRSSNLETNPVAALESIKKEINTDKAVESSSVADSRRYFGGSYSAFYYRSMLQRFKEIGGDLIGKVDLFVTSEWPIGTDETLTFEQKKELSNVLEFGMQQTKTELKSQLNIRSPAVSELVEYFEPRFHVAAGANVFYQRPIYRTSVTGLASKFIGLGRMSAATEHKTEKMLKFIHALVLKPIAELPLSSLLAVPSSSTFSPYFCYYNPKATLTSASPQRPKRMRSDTSDVANVSSLTPSFAASCIPPAESTSFEKRPRVSEGHSLALSTSTGVPASTSASTSPFGSSNPLTALQNLLRNSNGTSQRPPVAPPSDSPSQQSDDQPTTSVFVSNIPYDIDSNSFMDIMSSFGVISNIHFPRGQDGRSAGRAWVAYENVASAQQAVAASDQLETGGRLLKTQFSHFTFPNRRQYSEENGARYNNRGNGNRTPTRRVSQAIDVRPHQGCWFCLANPNCEKRLIVGIGDKVYIALAKGGMVHQHVLLIPVTHFPNFVFCPPDVGAELELYINALRECYRSQGLEAVVYERYFPMKQTTGMHMQLQIIPIPTKVSSRAVEMFESRADRAGIAFQVLAREEEMASLRRRVADPVNQPYFYVELPGIIPDKIERRLHISGPSSCNLSFNFGREAIAELLDVPHRSDWRQCVEPEVVETKLAQQMQKAFAPFQPK